MENVTQTITSKIFFTFEILGEFSSRYNTIQSG
jgi:hypothetical protein